ncbi:MAG: Hsp70 family protein [Micrococcales bacterium]|nr:Hsp70 family protein [Micrococcales bacterium]
MPGWVVAVDFGTVNTGAAICLGDGRTEKVKLDPSSDTMPSAVVLTEGRWRVGQAALNSRRTHPDTFISSPKARLGQEPVVLGDDLVEPAAIASHVLAAVRERAIRTAGGTDPDRLVLTHPVRWGRARLDALLEAARLAGFATETIRLLPEPIAALHAYVSPRSLPPGSRVAVVDTGGGTCDVAVLQTTGDPTPGRDLLVVAQEGDDRLGGNDLDDLLYRWVLAQLAASGRNSVVTALQDPQHLGAALTLLDAVRSAKQDLSEHTTAPIGVAVAGHEATLTITREEYEGLIAEPMARAAALTTRALSASGTTALAGLYLTGGTAYTPALSRALHQVTGILTAPIGDPKLAVAVGALKTPAVMNPAGLTAQAHQPGQPSMAPTTAQASPVPPHHVGSGPTRDVQAPRPTEPTSPQPTPPAAQPYSASAPGHGPAPAAAAPGHATGLGPPASPYQTAPTTVPSYATSAPYAPSSAYAPSPTYATGSPYTQGQPTKKRPQLVAVVAVLAAILLVVGGITVAVWLLNRPGGTPDASSPSSVDTPPRPTRTPTTPTDTPTPTETGSGTITATRPPGYPALNPADFSDEYCSVWRSTVGSSSAPDRWTPEGSVAFRDGYTQLAAVAPADAEMYLSTMVDFYTLLADALDSTSPTRSESYDAVIETDELRRNAELMLADSTIAACLF